MPLAAIVGLVVGSFLNVVVYRVPLGLSVSTPRSFCPTCDRQLSWWENVPLVSWLALRGRCHTCHQAISPRYPLVEAATAVVFGLIAWAWHGRLPTVGYCALAATAVSIALIEWGGKRAPLSVGSVGVGIGVVLLVPGLLVIHRGVDLVWVAVGLVAGSILFSALRTADPDCLDTRGHGRTLLPSAGVWLGGLGGRAVVAGLAGWIITSFVCLIVVWAIGRSGRGRSLPTIAATPLVTGVVVALAVSLGVAA